MLHSLRIRFVIAAFCIIGVLGVCLPAVAEVYCPQSAPCWGPCTSCPGYYPCVPNAANYGYFPTIWRPWPTERRPDQTFPQSIGREVVPAPSGEKPEPLPRVKVEEIPDFQPEGSPGAGATIEGVPGEPGIQSPLQPPPGGSLPGLPLESALPSLDTLPQTQPAPQNTAPKTDDTPPLLPNTTPADSLPPATDPLQTPGAGDGTRIDDNGYRALLLSDTSTIPSLPATAAKTEPKLVEASQVHEGLLEDTPATKEEEPLHAETRLKVPEAKPIALDGYCPVELLDKQAWTLGDERWSAEHNGIIYRFAKEAHMNRFMEEPGRYVPVQGGKDPVRLKRDKKTVSGQTDFCAIYKNRLYMFSSRESLTAFRQNPKQYSEPVIRR